MFLNRLLNIIQYSGPVAQWITRLPTEQKIAGSIPARIVLFNFTFLSYLNLGLQLTSYSW